MIKVENLTKYYGEHLAVDDLSFEIGEGHVYGFLGPNGAGKSTTMNILTGCLSATRGRILIDGFDIFEEPRKAKSLIGYLPEQPPLYLGESPVEYLRFVGEAKGLRGVGLKEQIDHVIDQTGLTHMRNRRISSLSKGYKQRVGIAQALLGTPRIIILDEPTVGLDPIQILEIRELIRSLGQEHTVIFSSHILSEVQAICDEILMIAHGRLVAFDTPENLERQLTSSNELRLTTDSGREEVQELLASCPEVTGMLFDEGSAELTHVTLRTDLPELYDFSRRIFTCFAENGKVILEMTLRRANLEDIFLELTDSADAVQQANTAGTIPEDDIDRLMETAADAAGMEAEASEFDFTPSEDMTAAANDEEDKEGQA